MSASRFFSCESYRSAQRPSEKMRLNRQTSKRPTYIESAVPDSRSKGHRLWGNNLRYRIQVLWASDAGVNRYKWNQCWGKVFNKLRRYRKRQINLNQMKSRWHEINKKNNERKQMAIKKEKGRESCWQVIKGAIDIGRRYSVTFTPLRSIHANVRDNLFVINKNYYSNWINGQNNAIWQGRRYFEMLS